MSLVVRVVEPGVPLDIGAAGVCLVGLAVIVAVCGSGPVVSVVYLGDWGVAA